MTHGDRDALNGREAIAAEVFAALGTGRQIEALSSRQPDFGLEEAYQIAASVRRMREARGEIPVGRKIGFTNRTIWAEYKVFTPIWGYVYDRTVHNLPEGGGAFSLAGLAEPRIEPEIVFGLGAAPTAGMDERTLLSTVDWVAHGFEVVWSIFAGWRFSAADTVAAFSLHGALLIGPRHSIGTRIEDWDRTLSTFEIDLKREDSVVDHGSAKNVLGGPVSALRHLIDVLAGDEASPPLRAGEVITTGSLTRALPVASGETWTTDLKGVALDGIRVRFA